MASHIIRNYVWVHTGTFFDSIEYCMKLIEEINDQDGLQKHFDNCYFLIDNPNQYSDNKKIEILSNSLNAISTSLKSMTE